MGEKIEEKKGREKDGEKEEKERKLRSRKRKRRKDISIIYEFEQDWKKE